MKDFFLLSVACLVHVISTQSHAPVFRITKDGPYNVSVTEGDSVAFNCNPFAIPEAKIVWLQNGKQIDADNPPRRFAFSGNRKSLTIRDVCRVCNDRESKTDLMFIQCNASNVHGYAFAQGYLNVLQGYPNVLKAVDKEEELRKAWYIMAGAGAVSLVLLLIGIFLPRRSSEADKRSKQRKVCKPSIAYENAGYASVNLPMENAENSYRSLRKEFSMYEQIGNYDSIGQSQEEVAIRKEGAADHSGECYRYESIDATRRGVVAKGGPLVIEDAIYDDTGRSISVEEEVKTGAMMNRRNTNDHESVQGKSGQFSKSGEKNIYSDLDREEVDPSPDIVVLDMNAKQENPYLDLVSQEVNPYLDLVSQEVNPYLDLVSQEVNPYLDLVSEESSPYLDLVSTEESPCLIPSLEQVHMNPYADVVQRGVNINSDLDSREVSLYSDLGPREQNNIYSDLGAKEVIPHLDLRPTKKTKHTRFWTRKK